MTHRRAAIKRSSSVPLWSVMLLTDRWSPDPLYIIFIHFFGLERIKSILTFFLLQLSYMHTSNNKIIAFKCQSLQLVSDFIKEISQRIEKHSREMQENCNFGFVQEEEMHL